MTDAATRADHALARSLHRHLARCGGFTLDRHTHRPLTAGLSVGADPHATLHVPWASWDHDRVARWVHRHRARRRRDDLHLGGWLDPHRAEVWLDLVRVFPEHERGEALEVGLRHQQHAVFDIGAETVWYLTGLTVAGIAAMTAAGFDPTGWPAALGAAG